jgi:hypothetical protein
VGAVNRRDGAMPFRIRRHERVKAAVGRILREELSDARAEAEDPHAALEERVHAVRTHVKRARSTLRLAHRRPARALDHQLRDLAHLVADARDAAIAEAVLRRLVELPPAVRNVPPLAGQDTHAERDLERAIQELRRLRREISQWPLTADGRSARRAVAASFREARQQRARLGPRSSATAFHEWRKVVKRLALQLRLVGRAVPELDRYFEDSIERLSDLLGEVHDLAVTREKLEGARVPPKARGGLRTTLHRLHARESEARAEALALGTRALAPRPRFVRASLDTGWRSWRDG